MVDCICNLEWYVRSSRSAAYRLGRLVSSFYNVIYIYLEWCRVHLRMVALHRISTVNYLLYVRSSNSAAYGHFVPSFYGVLYSSSFSVVLYRGSNMD